MVDCLIDMVVVHLLQVSEVQTIDRLIELVVAIVEVEAVDSCQDSS